jgi:hypothetical protein
MSPRTPLRFGYRFTFDDGTRREFTVELDPQTLAIAGPLPEPQPAWTRLGHEQCPNCPLREDLVPRCPIAERIHPLVAAFADRVSYERVRVEVEAAGRTYAREGALQECLGSLFGIYTVASGCPVLSRLRPMLATHLPFMSPDESTYRTVSAFLMAQYFLAEAGRPADFSLAALGRFLEELRVANAGLGRRLASSGVKDAPLNALFTLNALGEITSLELQTDALRTWRERFLAHWG